MRLLGIEFASIVMSEVIVSCPHTIGKLFGNRRLFCPSMPRTGSGATGSRSGAIGSRSFDGHHCLCASRDGIWVVTAGSDIDVCTIPSHDPDRNLNVPVRLSSFGNH